MSIITDYKLNDKITFLTCSYKSIMKNTHVLSVLVMAHSDTQQVAIC